MTDADEFRSDRCEALRDQVPAIPLEATKSLQGHETVLNTLNLEDVVGAYEPRDKSRFRTVVELLRRADLENTPLVHHGHPVRERQRFTLVMRDVDDSATDLSLVLFDL